MVKYAHEAIAYLQKQIDPHDRLNPKYAYLHQQIEAICKCLSDAAATEIPPIRVLLEVPSGSGECRETWSHE